MFVVVVVTIVVVAGGDRWFVGGSIVDRAMTSPSSTAVVATALEQLQEWGHLRTTCVPHLWPLCLWTPEPERT